MKLGHDKMTNEITLASILLPAVPDDIETAGRGPVILYETIECNQSVSAAKCRRIARYQGNYG
jgi:hypothetical protein